MGRENDGARVFTADVSQPAARARAVVAGMALPVAGPILATAVGKALFPSDGGGPPSWFGFLVAMLFALGIAVGVFGAVRATRKNQRVTVADGVLMLGERRVERSTIDSGYVVHHAEYDCVELQLQGGEPLSLRVAGGQGNALLDLLELGASQRRARVPLTTPGERALIGFGGGALGPLALVMVFGLVTAVLPQSLHSSMLASPFFSPVAAALAVSGAVFTASRAMKSVPDIEIGVDGVAYADHGFLRKRDPKFVAFDDVEKVQTETFGTGRIQAARIVLVHGSGDRTVVGQLHITKREQIEAIAARIRSALAAFRAGEGDYARVLERATQPVDAWLERLRALARGGGGYRELALADEELGRVVSDPKAPADVRVGAAVVLSSREDAAVRERVRIAADTAASPRLRVALESVASGSIDESAVAAALEAQADEEAVTDDDTRQGTQSIDE
jgi:hypothetical protein